MMIDFRNDVNKEIVSFLRKSIPIDIPIYNSDALTTKPNKNTRVEYSLRNFNSTGQTKSYTKKNVNSLKAYSFTGYDCQLVIRVIAKQETANLVANEIAGAMQTFEFLENYVNGLDIKNETMRIKTIPVDVNGYPC